MNCVNDNGYDSSSSLSEVIDKRDLYGQLVEGDDVESDGSSDVRSMLSDDYLEESSIDFSIPDSEASIQSSIKDDDEEEVEEDEDADMESPKDLSSKDSVGGDFERVPHAKIVIIWQ